MITLFCIGINVVIESFGDSLSSSMLPMYLFYLFL